jgi:hypothetical protein
MWTRVLASALQHPLHCRYRRQPGRLHCYHHLRKSAGVGKLCRGATNPTAYQLLHRLTGRHRRPYRHRVYAVLHGLRLGGLLASGTGTHIVRSLAFCRLHGLLGLPVYRAPHHGGQVLFGQDSSQVPSMENKQQGNKHILAYWPFSC